MQISAGRPSPNFDSRKGQPVDMLVLHYTGMPTAEQALDRLCDPAAKVSAHYLIEKDGKVHGLVDEAHRAWHAGESGWRGHRDINARSIGIELVNPGHEWGYQAFPLAQMKTLVALIAAIRGRHDIPARNIVGHSDVAPLRKQDPGELFDWRTLAILGIGLWPEKPRPQILSIEGFQQCLAEIGYAVAVTGRLDPETQALISAFQSRYRPARVDGLLDAETAGLAMALRAMAGGDDPNSNAGRFPGRATGHLARFSGFPASSASYPA